MDLVELHLMKINLTSLANTSELYHISLVRTRLQKVKPKMAEFEELSDVNPSPLRGQRSHKNTYTIQIKGSTIDIFNFVVFKSMNGTKITELAALRPLRGLRLTSLASLYILLKHEFLLQIYMELTSEYQYQTTHTQFVGHSQ